MTNDIGGNWQDGVPVVSPVEVVNRSSQRVNRRLITRIARLVARRETGTLADVVIALVDNDEITRVNEKWLGHSGATDVISFRYQADPLEGEVVVSIEEAEIQAEEYQVTRNREIARLVIHGMLHLFGHDDATPAERKRMHERENLYLSKLDKMKGMVLWLSR